MILPRSSAPARRSRLTVCAALLSIALASAAAAVRRGGRPHRGRGARRVPACSASRSSTATTASSAIGRRSSSRRRCPRSPAIRSRKRRCSACSARRSSSSPTPSARPSSWSRRCQKVAGREAEAPAGMVQAFEYQQALAWLGYAEDQNCIAHNGARSCMLPVKGSGVHTMPQAARKAGDLFLAYARKYDGDHPTDIQARWLLNVARQVSGDWPDGVPADLRLPDERVRDRDRVSGVAEPRFRARAVESEPGRRRRHGGLRRRRSARPGHLHLEPVRPHERVPQRRQGRLRGRDRALGARRRSSAASTWCTPTTTTTATSTSWCCAAPGCTTRGRSGSRCCATTSTAPRGASSTSPPRPGWPTASIRPRPPTSRTTTATAISTSTSAPKRRARTSTPRSSSATTATAPSPTWPRRRASRTSASARRRPGATTTTTAIPTSTSPTSATTASTATTATAPSPTWRPSSA